MTGDRSLDDYIETGGDAPDHSDDAPDHSDHSDDADDADATGEATTGDASSAVEPAIVTYRWTGADAECPRCGETAERLWRDERGADEEREKAEDGDERGIGEDHETTGADGDAEGGVRFVCAACKNW